MTDAAPVVTRTEAARLRDMALALVRGSTVGPNQTISSGRNATGRSLLLPGVNTPDRATYPAFWTRDPAWIAGGGLAEAEDAWGWLALLCETMNGSEARLLASGATIPPFAVADHVNTDGAPVYFPGTYDSGESQGGPDFGLLPPHDDQYWPAFTAYAVMVRSGDPSVGSRPVRTPLGEIPVWLACDLAHHAMEVDETSGLCLVRADRHQVDWGYNDTIAKSGLVLFPSLLRLESCLKLAALCEGCGQDGRASAFRAEAARIRDSIPRHFARACGGQIWLHSATGTGNVPDVWGTAFAVHRGFVDDELANNLCRALLDAFESGAAVRAGQVSHVLPDRGWPSAIPPSGTYQNGAYWGYPVGWYVHALSLVSRSAARDLFMDYMRAMREGWNETGVECAYECVNDELAHRQNPGYLTTVALPYVSLLEAGLLS